MDVYSEPGTSPPKNSSVKGRSRLSTRAPATTAHAGWLRRRRAMTKNSAIA